MFGFVTAYLAELDEPQKIRYQSVYCGICRQIREQSGQRARLSLSYDMTFLALLLMSLYEPAEKSGRNACMVHPIRKRPWTDNEMIRYSADMNVALAYYNCLDNWQDDGSRSAKWMAGVLEKHYGQIKQRYLRQCNAIETCIDTLSQLERSGCTNPDEPANCFGRLMAELLVYEEDMWSSDLRDMGMALGRFIYLADAAVDYTKDQKKNRYNPWIAMGAENDPEAFRQHLVLAMGRCTRYYESLPLVQDKQILDNILYGGVWLHYGQANSRDAEEQNAERSL